MFVVRNSAGFPDKHSAKNDMLPDIAFRQWLMWFLKYRFLYSYSFIFLFLNLILQESVLSHTLMYKINTKKTQC